MPLNRVTHYKHAAFLFMISTAGCQYGFFLQILVTGIMSVYSCKSFLPVLSSEAEGWGLKWSPAFLSHRPVPPTKYSLLLEYDY